MNMFDEPMAIAFAIMIFCLTTIFITVAVLDNSKIKTAMELGCEYRKSYQDTTITNCKIKNP